MTTTPTPDWADPSEGGWLTPSKTNGHVIVVTTVHEFTKFLDTQDPKNPKERDRAIVDYIDLMEQHRGVIQQAKIDAAGIINKLSRDGRPTIGRVEPGEMKPDGKVGWWNLAKVDDATKAAAAPIVAQIQAQQFANPAQPQAAAPVPNFAPLPAPQPQFASQPIGQPAPAPTPAPQGIPGALPQPGFAQQPAAQLPPQPATASPGMQPDGSYIVPSNGNHLTAQQVQTLQSINMPLPQ